METVQREWSERVTHMILVSMRGVYHQAGPAIQEEWENDENGGIKGFLTSIILHELKRGYMAGFAAGAEAAVNDAIKAGADLVFSEADNRIGGERAFMEWERNQ